MAVTNAAQTTSGAISFMERYSNTTREIGQNGRRGALMLSIHINHPDVEKFIEIKKDLSKVTGANISVKINDEFMQAVENDSEYILRFPVEEEPTKAQFVRKVKAKDVWDKIINAAHTSAEPGIIFWDAQHKYSTSSIYPNWKNISTNPCVVGSTLVAVADGRNAVPIEQLVKEGKDVPVYSLMNKQEK
jgi:ribonucleoside-diphosphate reductase alpha chain